MLQEGKGGPAALPQEQGKWRRKMEGVSKLDSCFYRAAKLAGPVGTTTGTQCLFSHSLLSLVRSAADMAFSLSR